MYTNTRNQRSYMCRNIKTIQAINLCLLDILHTIFSKRIRIPCWQICLQLVVYLFSNSTIADWMAERQTPYSPFRYDLSSFFEVIMLMNSPSSYICTKRKPPCISGMELVSLSCNRVFISAESVGRGWCKIAIATKWYPFHTTDKYGFLFMPWITDQYTFVRYTILVNKISTAVAKVIAFSIMTT